MTHSEINSILYNIVPENLLWKNGMRSLYPFKQKRAFIASRLTKMWKQHKK